MAHGPDIRIITLGEADLWAATALESGVPSHTWSFCNALSHSGLFPKLARLSNGANLLVVPFFERQWANTVDISTITAVSGATIRAYDPVLLELWATHARSQGWVAGYLQFTPDTDLSMAPDVRPGNIVFYLDIRRSDLIASASPIVRRKIRKAARIGTRLVDDRDQLVRAVISLHRQTIVRTAARPNYSYAAETLHGWGCDINNVVVGAAFGDSVEACAIFLVHGRRAEYHLGASSLSGRGLQTWLLYQGMLRLRDAGVASLNLGGGVSPGDGLFQFKEKFGGEARQLQVLRQVYRPDVYEQLLRASGVAASEMWFPPYRSRKSVIRSPVE